MNKRAAKDFYNKALNEVKIERKILLLYNAFVALDKTSLIDKLIKEDIHPVLSYIRNDSDEESFSLSLLSLESIEILTKYLESQEL